MITSPYNSNRADQEWAAETNKTPPLAEAWIRFKEEPGDATAFEKFGELMDERLRKMRYPWQDSDQADIRQEAFLLTLERLGRWHSLAMPERADDLNGLEVEITRCIQRSIIDASRRVSRKRAFALRNADAFAKEMAINPPAGQDSPNWASEPFELPPDARRALALAALRIAVNAKAIRPGDARMFHERISEGISGAEYARRHGISREAVHQREARAIPVLRRAVQKTEAPNP